MAINNKFRVKNGLTVGGDIDLTGTIDGRDLATDGAKLDNIETGATADQTKAEIDALNIDADTLDGVQSTSFLRSDVSDTKIGTLTLNDNLIMSSSAIELDSAWQIQWGGTNTYINGTSTALYANAGGSRRFTVDSAGIHYGAAGINTVWHAGNGGSGSGLDADTLDGQHGSYYAPQSTTYTKTQTDTAISNLVAAAPGTLDTLNELAAALGDDPNFATTLTNSIATKLPLAGGTMSGGINYDNYFETYAASYTVSTTNRQALLWNGSTIPAGGTYRFTAHIDGTGTDNAATAVYWNQNGVWKLNVTCQSGTSSNNPEFIIENSVPTLIIDHTSNYTVRVYGERMQLREGTGTDNYNMFGADGFMSSVGNTLRYNPSGSGTTYATGNTVWHASNDGSGSGLDADLLDGIQGSSFLRSDTADSTSHLVTFSTGINVGSKVGTWIGSSSMADSIGWNTSYGTYIGSNINGTHYLRGNGTFSTPGGTHNLWHAGNDGSGSGLDADLLDGLNSSSFVRTDTSSSITGDLDVTGSIGVGTSTPEQLLHAKSGDTPVLRLEQDSSSGWGAQTWDIGGNESKFFIRDINGGTLPFMIKAGALQSTLYISIGGVGIGTTTPLGRFDVRNTSNTTSYLNVATDGKIGLGITSVGATNALQHSNGAHLTSSGTWNSVSDIRIKENIEVIPDALNKVMQLRGITYDRIGMDVTRDTGVIAQELMAVLPEAVSGGPTEDSPEDIYGVAYGNMAGMFVEAIKEQQVIVASQKAEIDELRVLLSAVTARLDGAGL